MEINERVRYLLDDIYEYYNNIPSFTKLMRGEYSKKNRFPDLSYEAILENKEVRDKYRKRINDIRDTTNLTNYDLLVLDEAEYFIDYSMFPISCLILFSCFNEEFYYLTFNITTYNMPVSELWDYLKLLDCSSRDNVKKHMELTKDYIRFCKQIRDKVFEQANRGIYLFSDAINGSCEIIKSCALVNYDEHPLNMKRPGSAATQEQIEIEKGYIQEANKYLMDIVKFLESRDYKEKAPKNLGWNQYENGLEYYRYLRKYHLSYDLSAEELHNLGISLLEKADKKQEEIRKKLGLNCSHEKFLETLKGNERFYPTKAEKIGELMNNFKNLVSDNMDKYFNEKIETPCSIKRLSPNLEESMTFGFFNPSQDKNVEGVYYYNGSGLEEKCQINIPALITHELLPGHHFQQSFVSESETLHPLLKEITTGCYLEGWAEYASILLREVGLFDDYDEYGRLEMQKMGCARLIVDTGVNELGWNKDKAVDFLINNTFATPQMAESEVLRYATSIPAQCLPYKYGCVKMLELREKYKKAKGKDYNIKDFHSLILGVGNVPMSLLEKYIDSEDISLKYKNY